MQKAVSMTDMKNNPFPPVTEVATRVQVIAELLDADGVPADITTGNALVNLGIDMIQLCGGVPKDIVAAMLEQCAVNVRNNVRHTK